MRNCANQSIAPQALPQTGDTLKSVPYQFSNFDGRRVNYSQVDEAMYRVNRFPKDGRPGESQFTQSNLGLYNSGLVCAKGISNIDNQCLCPGSNDTMPYNIQPVSTTTAVTNMLFTPFLHNSVPQLTPSAQKLVAERSRLPAGEGSYYQMDAPLPC